MERGMMTEKQREELKLKAKAAIDKENVRNNKDNAVGLHEYSIYCSCGCCHTADLVVEALVEHLDKNWIKFETSQETMDLIKAMDEGEEAAGGIDAVFGTPLELANLDGKDLGRWVTYKTPYATERGRIKRWTDKVVFVVYKCDSNWDRFRDYTACATNPEDLIFEDN